MRIALVLFLTALPAAGFAGEHRGGHGSAPVRVAAISGDSQTAPTAPLVAGGKPCEGGMDEASLQELVREEAKKLSVDEKLALVILNIESNDGADLNSSKGARGPMQLMPATAAQYGVTDICNPVENVRGGLRYLRDLSAQFDGNLMLIAAAYNAGSERVYRANGVPPISETVRYVAAAANKYYGLNALAARHGKGQAPTSRETSSTVDYVASTPAAKVGGQGQQRWIGGTVLYVSPEEGDK
ncbi:MAG: lytic transglycosylase domain-containing protein [Hyphomicrobiales bacterium]|nr:lytic transglycosylase domain-containing protein [Hyphomicrobiales bacterium]